MLKFLIIILLFFVILNSGIIDYIKKKFKLNEPFSKTTNIVLLGDNFLIIIIIHITMKLYHNFY